MSYAMKKNDLKVWMFQFDFGYHNMRMRTQNHISQNSLSRSDFGELKFQTEQIKLFE
jgi:hypothetical protein